MPWMPEFTAIEENEDWLEDFFQGDKSDFIVEEEEECEGMDHPLFVSCDIHSQLFGSDD